MEWPSTSTAWSRRVRRPLFCRASLPACSVAASSISRATARSLIWLEIHPEAKRKLMWIDAAGRTQRSLQLPIAFAARLFLQTGSGSLSRSEV